MVNTLALILTGITTSIIGLFIYNSGDKGIRSGGLYQSKNSAVKLVAFEALIIGLITPVIYEIYVEVFEIVNPLTIVGVIVIAGTFLVNEDVSNWRHDTDTSLLLYGSGLVLIFVGVVI